VTRINYNAGGYRYQDLVDARIISGRGDLNYKQNHFGFPRPIKTGSHSAWFPKAEVHEWLSARAALRDSGATYQLDLPIIATTSSDRFASGPFVGLPRAHFTCAHIDLPWSFKTWSPRGQGKGASKHDKVSDLHRLVALPVPELMAPDAVLFFWVTQPLLPQALQILSDWGLTYKSVAVYWVKMPAGWAETDGYIRPRMGLGYHTRSGAEQCWIATRGRGYERKSRGVLQVIHAPIREHSRKPDEAAERIEQLVGDVPRIELFARTRRPGWSSWGEEVGRFDNGGGK
jgi:N6-adenosine-specific RNA methylase IME4